MQIRFITEYDGSCFHGWQVQPDALSVQENLEQAFSKALRTPVQIWGSGRTDAGVHARGQVAVANFSGMEFANKTSNQSTNQILNQNINRTKEGKRKASAKNDTSTVIPDLHTLTRSVNALSHTGVCVRDLEFCSEEFNPRFEAKERYYTYTLHTRPTVLQAAYGWNTGGWNLDHDLMQQAAQSFLGEHDFLAFSIPRNDGKSTLCTLTEFRLEQGEGYMRWHIRGNRFLHRMVRSMVGLLSDVGRGRHPADAVEQVFEGTLQGERTWAPPQGLVLEGVYY